MRMMIDIPEELVTDIKDYCGMSMTDAKKALPTILNAIHNGIPLEQIRDEIERLHYHPKLDFIKNDEVVEMALDIIDKYKAESEDKQ